jgi:hypothetical protein
MYKRFHTYAAYSIACFVVWGIILVVRVGFHLHDPHHEILDVFCGWTIGWLSATIARKVYA